MERKDSSVVQISPIEQLSGSAYELALNFATGVPCASCGELKVYCYRPDCNSSARALPIGWPVSCSIKPH